MIRKIAFQNEYFYHIFNRGVDKRRIFNSNHDYTRFMENIRDFNNTLTDAQRKHLKSKSASKSNLSVSDTDESVSDTERWRGSVKPLVEIICYSLLTNHFHFLLRQLSDDGITCFMRKLSGGYTNYFNLKNERSGHLFQGAFKAVPVETDEQLLYLSAYVNGNVEIHKIAKAEDWEWGSYKDYIGKRNGTLCNKKIILAEFKHIKDYQKYVKIVIKESGQRKEEVNKYELD